MADSYDSLTLDDKVRQGQATHLISDAGVKFRIAALLSTINAIVFLGGFFALCLLGWFVFGTIF